MGQDKRKVRRGRQGERWESEGERRWEMVERGGVEGGSNKERKRVIGYTVTCFCSTHVGWSHHITAEVTAKLVSRELGVFSLCVRHRKGGASRRSVTHTHTTITRAKRNLAIPHMACVHIL